MSNSCYKHFLEHNLFVSGHVCISKYNWRAQELSCQLGEASFSQKREMTSDFSAPQMIFVKETAILKL